jgi:hypothetical protein
LVQEKPAQTRQGPSIEPEHPSTPADELVDARMRVLLSALGAGLLATGVVAAFVADDGVTTAALMAAGFALVFLGYLGRYITHIRFREFEAELVSLQRRVTETVDALENLEAVARRYETIRADMTPGAFRDDALEAQLAEAMTHATRNKPTPSQLGELDRIAVLGAMKAHPDLRDPELVLHAIEKFDHPFDHDRFLVLAAEMLYQLDTDQRQRLRDLIERQRSDGTIKPHHVRWATSERLLRLMAR